MLANTFYLYYPSYGVFETTNGGVSWTKVITDRSHSRQLPTAGIRKSSLSLAKPVNLFFTPGPIGGSQPVNVGFYRSTDQGATWTAVPNVLEVSTFGFGAPAPGQSYPSIYIVGWVNNVYGIWESDNNAQSWTQIGTYPIGSLDQITTISGDSNKYGQVYLGFRGSGYAYLPAGSSASPGPQVLSITETPASGDLNAGHTSHVDTCDERGGNGCGGIPTLTLNDGGTATYTGGSGTGALTFSYTVAAGQNTASLSATAVNLNGATVQDGSGNAANLTLTGLTQTGPQIDTTAPMAPSITSFSTDSGVVGDHITNDNTLTLSGTAEANSTVKVYDGATLLGSAVANGSGAWTTPPAALTNGAPQPDGYRHRCSRQYRCWRRWHSRHHRHHGAGGAGHYFIYARHRHRWRRITTANVLTLSGTAEANSTVKIFDGATLLNSVVANASGAWSYTTAALSNGAHSLTATATDAAGNTGVASSALAITVTAPPGAPTIASFSPDTGVVGDGITDPAILTLSGSAWRTVRSMSLTVRRCSAQRRPMPAGPGACTIGRLPNGAHSFTATDTVSGVTSAASAALNVTIDTVAPVAPVITSFTPDTGTVGDGITTANVLTLSGTAEANSTVKIFDGATLLNSVVANASGAWTYTTAALSNGAHSLTATATDAAGNTGVASSVLAITVTPPPGAPTIASFTTDSGVVGDHITNDSTLTLSGSAIANSTVKIFDGATLLNSVVANASGAWSYTTAALSNGVHSFTATDTVSGVTSAASAALNVTIDTVAPVAPTVASFSTDSGVVGDHITNDSTLTLSGTAEANATVNIFDGATLLNSVVANTSGAWTIYNSGAFEWRP